MKMNVPHVVRNYNTGEEKEFDSFEEAKEYVEKNAKEGETWNFKPTIIA